MSNIAILDCTLRDGGYINDWNFGKRTIKKILHKLTESQIDIVECGFITDVKYDENYSLFSDLDALKQLLPIQKGETMFVGMIALGEKEIDFHRIPVCNSQTITGIRLTFHREEIDRAIGFAQNLMSKGYKVFMQPVGTMTYSDLDLIKLIERINELNPYAFYIVDTFGAMYKDDLLRLFYLVDNNLDDSISIGFHSHNNLQLSFSNTQELLKLHTKRAIIIDSSVFGMGRGAGNLCSELITQYVNDNICMKYNVIPLLEIIDEHLLTIKQDKPWGYSAPHYIAAVNKCHPNYATHLINKQTILVKDIDKIIRNIPQHKRDLYDKKFIEQAYLSYQQHYVDDTADLQRIEQALQNRKVLILAPGKTLITETQKVERVIAEQKPIVISINFISKLFSSDFVFVSNLKRFENLDEAYNAMQSHNQCIVTSNVSTQKRENQFIINYSNFTVEDPIVADNAGLMLLILLKKCSVSDIYLAGFDGFNENNKANYFDDSLTNNIEYAVQQEKNLHIENQLHTILGGMRYEFITTTQYNL